MKAKNLSVSVCFVDSKGDTGESTTNYVKNDAKSVAKAVKRGVKDFCEFFDVPEKDIFITSVIVKPQF